MCIRSPSPGAPSRSSSLMRQGLVRGTFTGSDHCKDMVIRGEAASYQCLGDEGSSSGLECLPIQDNRGVSHSDE